MNLTNKVLINSSDRCYLVLGKSTEKNLYYLQELKANRLCKCDRAELEKSLKTGLVRIISDNLAYRKKTRRGSNAKKLGSLR